MCPENVCWIFLTGIIKEDGSEESVGDIIYLDFLKFFKNDCIKLSNHS